MSSFRSRSAGPDGEHIEAIVEVAAERTAANRGREIALVAATTRTSARSRRSADSLELALLQHPQHAIWVSSAAPHLVEENRSPRRDLEAPARAAARP